MSGRVFFTKNRDLISPPNLIEIQKNSYEWFFKEGLKELFEEISPIKDYTGRDLELYFGDYYLDEPKFDEITARERNTTYEAPLRVNVKLVNKRTKSVQEQEVYLGDFPLMTERGTFVINGVERVVVSQLIRSPGVFFTSDNYKGRKYYGAKIIPNRGAWLEFETIPKSNLITVKIDRKRKIPFTTLLRAFGLSSDEEIIKAFDGLNSEEMEYVQTGLEKDTTKNEAEGLKEVYKKIRPGDLATVDNAKSLIYAMFFRFDRYDFGRVGRYKLNKRFGQNYPLTQEHRVLKVEDIVNVVKEIIRLNVSQKEADDVDHLGNRRVRAIGELFQSKLRVGLARMNRIIIDRMSTKDLASITPAQLVNSRPVIAAIKEFFTSFQLSQFMDQINPLAELEHKRRLSALGPGGLTRERAGFEVRDVHRTHYGRICPIATSEGANIGLIGHLATYARLNEFGFLETPFIRVKDRKITGEVEYLDAFEEEKHITTIATSPLEDDNTLADQMIEVRKYGEPEMAHSSEVEYIDVSPKQIISVSTSLIPFLEHDDATRALMGTNMQRQAVPLVKTDSPIVGTGAEEKAARDCGHLILAKKGGVVEYVDSNKIVIREDGGEMREYRLGKFVRSNMATCLNQKPIVNKGDRVEEGDVIADGASIDHGELALGANLLVAFMSWEGGNFEDAILISERLVREDILTSIHIETYSIDVRDTKLGPEVVTRDIPNISEEKLKDLDENGIIRIGANVESGDILVGKISPKGEAELTAEERLLRAIFGEKAKEVKDSSLYLSHGERGKVIDVKVFSRESGDKLASGVIKQIEVTIANLRKIQVGDKLAGRHGNKGVISRIVAIEDMPFMEDGTPIDVILNPLGIASRMNLGQVLELHLGLAAWKQGIKVATPALNGVPEDIIKQELKKVGFEETGKMKLIDGRTGDKFEHPVTVGIMYILKLNHMVEDKIHQRSIGPYSLVTQQPLGGKAQFGGQRFGEMEVWALEAYGAAYTLQEILTIKSDDVLGRSKAYEAIIKGEDIKHINIPESFHVLVKELKGLCLDVELLKNNKPVEDDNIYKE